MEDYDFDSDNEFKAGLRRLGDNPSDEVVQQAKQFYYARLTPSLNSVVEAINTGKSLSLPHTSTIPSTVVADQPSSSSTQQPKKPWD